MKRLSTGALALAIFLLPTPAFADAVVGQTQQQPTNWIAVAMFSAFAVLTLGITRWAAHRT